MGRNALELRVYGTGLFRSGDALTPTNGKKFTLAGWAQFDTYDQRALNIVALGFTAANDSAAIYVDIDGYITAGVSHNGSGTACQMISSTQITTGTKYFFKLTVDTTQATPGDRVRFWVGEYQSSSQPTEIQDGVDGWSKSGDLDQDVEFDFGTDENWNVGYYSLLPVAGMDGYLADLYFVDGASLTANGNFADLSSGQLLSKPYSGSFGSTGWHLDFADPFDIGNDAGGNNLDFTVVAGYVEGPPISVSAFYGDMTSGGGLAAAFDGNHNQSFAASANATFSGSGRYVGADLSASPKRIYKIEVYGSNDEGYLSGSNAQVDLYALYKNGSQPATVIDFDAILSGPAAANDTNDESGAPRLLPSSDASVLVDYVHIGVFPSAAVSSCVSEIIIYEALPGTLDDDDITLDFLDEATDPNLQPPLFVDTDSFYTPTITATRALTPSLFTDTDQFYSPTVALGDFLSPSLYTDSDVFHAPTVAASNALSPSLYADNDTFFGPTVSASSALAPNLYTDSDVFFGPAVSPGAVALAPSLFVDADTFYSPALAGGSVDLQPSLFSDTDQFFAPTVSATAALTPALFTDTDTFFQPTVAPGAVALTPSLFTDTDSFFSPTVTGAQALTPSLYADTDTFHNPAVSATKALTPSLFTDTDTFFSPTVAPGARNLTPSLFVNTDTFFSPAVSLGQGIYTRLMLTSALARVRAARSIEARTRSLRRTAAAVLSLASGDGEMAMAYVGTDFTRADPSESELYSFNFANDIPTGETISSATWTCGVADRSKLPDASASSRLSGSPVNSGQVTTQRVAGLQAGVIYYLRALVTTNTGNVASLWAYVECSVPGLGRA